MKKEGLKVNVTKGANGWNIQMNKFINAFIKKTVFQKKKEYKMTYKRISRRSGIVKDGDMLKKGKITKKNNFVINMAFYVDRSGSMGGSIDNVFNAAYKICEVIKKQYRKEKVVDDVVFKMHVFDYNITEIKFGSKVRADGGTAPFHKLLQYITSHTNDYLVNVIITDAGMDMDRSEIKKFMKDINNLLIFITNVHSSDMESIANEYSTQLKYILADSQFELD